MKNVILCLFSMLFSANLLAQNPRIENFSDFRTETYAFKRGIGDSIRFKIKDKADTLQTTFFYRNGKPSTIRWKQDSSYLFDYAGRLSTIYYGLKESFYDVDSSVVFHPNGQQFQFTSRTKEQLVELKYDENGHLLTSSFVLNTPSVEYSRREDRYGKPISSTRTDKIFEGEKRQSRTYDTTFYENGQPYRIRTGSYDELYRFKFNAQYFKQDGSLWKSDMPDSLKLTPFKDNVDCYYGLKNDKGDTIISPRFDQIVQEYGGQFMSAYTGNQCILLTLDGKPMAQPTANLTGIRGLVERKVLDIEFSVMQDTRDIDIKTRKLALQNNEKEYFVFYENKKSGVMTKDGAVVIPSQYFNLAYEYLDNAQYFQFTEYEKGTPIQTGYLNRQGKALFVDKYKSVTHTGYTDFFYLQAEAPNIKNMYNSSLFGLGNGSNEAIVLEPKFSSIEYLPHTSLFIATLPSQNVIENLSPRKGLYNPRTQKWLVDTTFYSITNRRNDKSLLFVVQNLKTKKYALIDTIGREVLPFSKGFDSIGIADGPKGLYWVKKGKDYQVLEMKNGQVYLHETKYAFLKAITFSNLSNTTMESITYFLAKKQRKWGLLDANEQVIKPFDYDYTGQDRFADVQMYSNGFFLVKDGYARYFNLSSIPNENPDWAATKRNEEMSASNLFNLFDAENTQSVFFIDDLGKVIIPPQYKIENTGLNGDYIESLDAQKKRKLIFLETGEIVDFPFTYYIVGTHPKSRVILVKDTAKVSFGVVSTKGKLLIPCVNYAVAIGDVDKSVFFVKRDTPHFEVEQIATDFAIVSMDSLSAEDKNWVMYNADGQFIGGVPFRFPIDFQQGIGVGVQGEDFNLYKTDGTILTPFYADGKPINEQSYNNIWRVEPTNFYALFRNRGLTPTMTLTDRKGQILVESGRYNGISRFYGKYALVKASGMVGLIDSFGHEIIAPQDLSMSQAALMDSIDVYNKKIKSDRKDDYSYIDKLIELPIIFNQGDTSHPDSLKISAFYRTALLNLMLQKSIENTIATAKNNHIPRVFNVARAATFYPGISSFSNRQNTLTRETIADSTISFGWVLSLEGNFVAYNFKRKGGRWEELKFNDLLNLQGEKYLLFNDFLTRKIKALKDVSIDCSNSSTFLKQVENRLMMTEKGIDFCFDSTNGLGSGLVIVSFTWDELKSYLK